jgi:hypothetical protein
VEAVFPPEIFRIFSDRFLSESTGSWLEYCFHFRLFSMLPCRIQWP